MKKAQASRKNKEPGLKGEKNCWPFSCFDVLSFPWKSFFFPKILPSPSKKDLNFFSLRILMKSVFIHWKTILRNGLPYLTTLLSFTLFTCYSWEQTQGLTPICYSQWALSQVETLDYYRISHQPLHKQKMNQFLSQSSPLTSAVLLLKHWFLTTMSGTQSLTLGKLWTKQNPFPETGQLKPLEWSSTVVSCCMLVIRVQIDSYFIIILQILP